MTGTKHNQSHTNLLAKFVSFDAKFNSELSLDAPRSVEESLPRLSRLIDALPQREAIQQHHADRWIDRCFQMAVSRMELEHGEARVQDVHSHILWHIRRASGFGGSEAGTITKHFEGKRGNFTNAHNLVMEKLLILAPQPSTPEMSRGIRAEPWIQRMYHEQTGAQTDQASLELLRGFRWDRAPFLAGTPDDIVITLARRRKVVDYKAPSADVCSEYEKDGISQDYQFQLHHYGIISMAAGCRFHEMSIEVFDPRVFEVVCYPVEFNRDIARDIVSASRTLWLDNVMQGVVPAAPTPDTLNSEDPDLVDFGYQAAMLRAMKDAVSAREKDMIDRIATLGTIMHDKATGNMALGVADYSRQRGWDEDAIVALANSAGIDVAEHRKTHKDLDTEFAVNSLRSIITAYKDGEDIAPLVANLAEKGLPNKTEIDCNSLADALEEAGVDTLSAATVKAKFALTRKKKGPGADKLAELKMSVEELMEALDDVVRDTASKIIVGEPVSEDLPEMELMEPIGGPARDGDATDPVDSPEPEAEPQPEP